MGFYNFKQKILMPSKVDLNATIGYGKKTYHMQHALIHYMLLNNINKYSPRECFIDKYSTDICKKNWTEIIKI